MQKPTMQSQAAMSTTVESIRLIALYAPPDFAGDLYQFGEVFKRDNDRWELYVDPRYDYTEVLAYVRTLVEQSQIVNHD